jgi:HTH-type transcriptional regulator/antitoxin HigA
MATNAGKKREPVGVAEPSARKQRALVSDRYLELVRSCPLRVIRNEEAYDQAIDTLNDLSDRGADRTPDETEYLLALAVFVEKYEDEHDPIPPASGADMLRALMEARQITGSDVAAGSGLAVTTISDLLDGKRRFTLEHVERLARFFQVKPSFFIDG